MARLAQRTEAADEGSPQTPEDPGWLVAPEAWFAPEDRPAESAPPPPSPVAPSPTGVEVTPPRGDGWDRRPLLAPPAREETPASAPPAAARPSEAPAAASPATDPPDRQRSDSDRASADAFLPPGVADSADAPTVESIPPAVGGVIPAGPDSVFESSTPAGEAGGSGDPQPDRIGNDADRAFAPPGVALPTAPIAPPEALPPVDDSAEPPPTAAAPRESPPVENTPAVEPLPEVDRPTWAGSFDAVLPDVDRVEAPAADPEPIGPFEAESRRGPSERSDPGSEEVAPAGAAPRPAILTPPASAGDGPPVPEAIPTPSAELNRASSASPKPPGSLFAPPPAEPVAAPAPPRSPAAGLASPHGAGSGAAAREAAGGKSADESHRELFAKNCYPSAQDCAECHQRIYDEWSVSSHAYAYVSPMFHAFENKLTILSEGTVGHFCTRCHSPIATAMNEARSTPLGDLAEVAREGVTCIVCHRVNQAWGRSNGDRRVVPGDLYAPVYGGVGGEGVAKAIAEKEKYKVKTSPEEKGPGQPIHAEGRFFDQLTRAEACTSCHQVAVHPGIKLEVVWEQYRASPACKKGVTCQECHMGRVPGVAAGWNTGPIAELNGKVVSNQRKQSSHIFYGPGYSIAHPGVFPQNKDAARWTV
ncbi:MAG: multiheme c-type cytochrome, partial [Planctomycetota bacterium]